MAAATSWAFKPAAATGKSGGRRCVDLCFQFFSILPVHYCRVERLEVNWEVASTERPSLTLPKIFPSEPK